MYVIDPFKKGEPDEDFLQLKYTLQPNHTHYFNEFI